MQTGTIVKGNGLNHDESIAEVHLTGRRTLDMGGVVLILSADDKRPLSFPLYEGFGKRFPCC